MLRPQAIIERTVGATGCPAGRAGQSQRLGTDARPEGQRRPETGSTQAAGSASAPGLRPVQNDAHPAGGAVPRLRNPVVRWLAPTHSGGHGVARTPVEVTEHACIACTCPPCQRRCVPTAQRDGVALGQQRLGINLLSLIAARVRGSPMVCADETGWREDGHNGPICQKSPGHSVSTLDLGYFLRRGRGKAVVDEALGEEFAGWRAVQRLLLCLPSLRRPQASANGGLGPPAAGHPRSPCPLPGRSPVDPMG